MSVAVDVVAVVAVVAPAAVAVATGRAAVDAAAVDHAVIVVVGAPKLRRTREDRRAVSIGSCTRNIIHRYCRE